MSKKRKAQREEVLIRMESPCTACDFRLFVESAEEGMPKDVGAADVMKDFLRRLEGEVYGDKPPSWPFTEQRALVISLMLHVTDPELDFSELEMLLRLCAFPDDIAREIVIDIPNKHVSSTPRVKAKLDEVFRVSLRRAKERRSQR